MINAVARWFVGYVEFSFSDGFASGFVDECFKQGLNLFDIRCEAGVTARCPISTYKELHSIARRHGGRVRIIKKLGFPFLLSKLLFRHGLAVGLLLSVALFCFLSNFVWNIEYVGNGTIEEQRLEQFLDENDFRVGSLWSVQKKQQLEELMLASFDEIAWVHINRVGTTAKVEISEATPKPNIESKVATNLKATKDGVIVYAMVNDGWQEAFVGDSVTKGTTLVSGVYAPEGKKENLFAHASGEFVARVNENFELTISREQCKKEYLDEKQYKAIRFFGAYIPLYFGKIPTDSTELYRSSKYITINGNPVPIGISTTAAKQYRIYTVSLADKELLELADKLVNQKLNANYGKDNIVSRNITVNLNPSSATASGKVEHLENIAQEVRLMSKKQKNK